MSKRKVALFLCVIGATIAADIVAIGAIEGARRQRFEHHYQAAMADIDAAIRDIRETARTLDDVRSH